MTIPSSMTVVIPVHDGASTIAAQLAALDRQIDAPAFSVVVVDNGSSDASAEIVRAFALGTAMDIRVVAETRLGVNLARNAGIRAAGPGTILLCDADDEVDERWVAAMSAALSADSGCWVSGILDFRRLNSTGTRALWGGAETTATLTPVRFKDTGWGGNCGFQRTMWEQLGGFDDSLSGYGDETEFLIRCWSAGYGLRWVPEAVVHCRQRSQPASVVVRRYRQGVAQSRLSRRPTWPAAAGVARFWTAARSSASAACAVVVAVFRRQPVWPAVALTALHLGRVRGSLRQRTGPMRSAP